MDVTHAQEQFSKAFVLALAALAGCSATEPQPDIDSIDWTLSCRLSRRPKLDTQVKSVRNGGSDSDHIAYPLKRKNYEDLRLPELLVPRMLVLVVVPDDPADWLRTSADELTLRRCAHWHSLASEPHTTNQSSVTVRVPRANLLTVGSLVRLMNVINEGGVP